MPESVEELIVLCLTALDSDGPDAMHAILNDHPDQSEEVLKHIEALQLAGFVEDQPSESVSQLTRPQVGAGESMTDEHLRESIGPYEILSELGRGGQGVVYRANDTRLNRVVALKLLPTMLDLRGKTMERFRREAEAAARLNNPGICSVYEFGDIEGAPFIAMQLVEGQSLDKRIRDARKAPSAVMVSGFIEFDAEASTSTPVQLDTEQPPSGIASPVSRAEVNEVCRLFEEAARVLHVAHEAGMVHRDVKPSNIMVTPDGHAVILDFGLVQMDDGETLTMTGDQLGTPAYMSPEQVLAAGTPLDARTDIYSLGVSLFECLTLRRPFQGTSRAVLYQSILTKEPPRLNEFNGALSRDLQIVVETAIERDRDRRYSSALDFADELRRVRTLKPILARPAGHFLRLRRWAQRQPLLAASLGTILLILSGALAISLELLSEVAAKKTLADEAQLVAERERRTALAERDRAQAVTSFLNNDLLLQASPLKKGKDAKLREVLDRASDRIEGRFDRFPLAEADIRMTIGKTYRDLGLYDAARPHLQAAYQIRDTELGASNQRTLAAGRELAGIYYRQGQYDLAMPMLQKLLATANDVLGKKHTETLQIAQSLSLVWHAQGNYPKAQSLFEEVVELTTETLGPESPQTLASLSGLAGVLSDRGQLIQAEAMLTSVIKTKTRVLGDEDHSTLHSIQVLTSLYYQQGAYDKAEPLLTKILSTQEKILGEDHPQTLQTLNRIGSLYGAQGDMDKAQPIFERILKIRRETLGERNPNTLASMNNLGFIYLQRGKFESARPLFEKALQEQTRIYGKRHPTKTLSTMSNLAMLHRAQGNYEEAEALALVSAQTAEEDLGLNHQWTRNFIHVLIGVYKKWGKKEQEAKWRAKLSLAKSPKKSGTKIK